MVGILCVTHIDTQLDGHVGGQVMWRTLARITGLSIFMMMVLLLMGMKPMTAERLEAWFNDPNSTDEAEQQALAVNEGELEFLTHAPQKRPHSMHNEFTISPQSLKDGWIKMVQCHDNLDVVSIAQILYHARRTRHLQVLSHPGIARAWVEKNSVQLENIGKNAKLCVQAEVHSLYSNFDGSYSMYNGPFLRKFLDGYYPMRVTMDVNLPGDQLSFEAINPQAQAGFRVSHSINAMQVDALFVGELSIEVMFSEKSPVMN